MRNLQKNSNSTLWLLMPSLALGVMALCIDAMPQPVSSPAASEQEYRIVERKPAQTSLKIRAPKGIVPRSTQRSNLAAPVRATKVVRSAVVRKNGRAPYEPASGIYLGAALDTAQLNNHSDIGSQLVGEMRDWDRESGRKHALHLGFIQFPYDDGAFPSWDKDPRGWMTAGAFCDAATTVGAAPIVTMEPFGNPLQFVNDWKAGSASYNATQEFAQAAGKWGKPLFIRFAHEMNGSWYPWAEWTDKNRNMRRDPGEETGFTADDYRKAYRNVAAMFRRFAPNAALIWCPNSGLLGGERRDAFRPFYPGDDVVDWVGLDVYERGWTDPMPGAKLWAGQFAHNLTFDSADDPNTSANESVNFYKVFAAEKNKPMMLCETSATLSYRNDLNALDRGAMNNAWKTGYWNQNEYGWMLSVYGTSIYTKQTGQKLLYPVDQNFPRLKGIVWFQVAKRETVPVEKTDGDRKKIIWFDDAYTDYRIGGGVEQNAQQPFLDQEVSLYRRLTNSPYFLSSVKR